MHSSSIQACGQLKCSALSLASMMLVLCGMVILQCMRACRDATVNHAVLLVGYGHDSAVPR